MSLPKEPRQLMINLMYLVLTALLAMNVSSEILNAFKIVDKSINSSTASVETKNQTTLENFKLALEDPKIIADPVKYNKVKQFLDYAEQVVSKTKTMQTELEGYKQEIITRAGGFDPNNPGLLLREDDLDAATAVMVEGDKKGNTMKASLTKFKSEIAAFVPTTDDNLNLSSTNTPIEKKLPINFDFDPSKANVDNDWSFANFHMVPAVGAITIMDKYMNDVKISESVVLDELWAKAFGERRRQVPVFKDYAILVSAPNTYLLPGEKYTANIMLGAYNKTSNNLTIRVNGSNVQVKDGIATYTATANGKGEQTINVAASYTDPNEGTTKNYTSKASYFVGEGQASISLDKMNVFYIGVPNPITFSASGVPAGSLKYSAENCTLTPVEGVNKYVVNVTTPGAKAKISLSGKRGDGTSTTFGTWEYRIKRIPDPYPVIAGKKGGSAVANELKVQDAIIARLDYFDFDAKFSVTSFTVTYLPRRGDPEEAQSNSQYLSGPNASPSVSAIMAKLKPGDKIFFENIKAIGPDKTPRSIGSVNFICNN
jgi:gliding motility-associated protein GldM